VASIEFRPAREDDLESGARVFNRAQNELYRQRGLERGDKPAAVFAVPQGYILRTDPGRCFVATAGSDVVAYTSSIVRGGAWYFSALFVEPAFQGQGIGRALFELSASDWPRRRMTIVDAIQPISTGLYTAHGLIPSTPVLALGGTAQITAPRGLEASIPTPNDLAEIDNAAYGFDRKVDHEFWATVGELTVWRRDGRAIAYSYVSAGGTIGPLAGRTAGSAALALRAELSRHRTVDLEVPGSAAALVETAFAAGLRYVNPPGLLLHSRPHVLPTALVISGYWLM
jgi:GNAT superfamily N-acetyltransferase